MFRGAFRQEVPYVHASLLTKQLFIYVFSSLRTIDEYFQFTRSNYEQIQFDER